jgi:transposase InsO family protein
LRKYLTLAKTRGIRARDLPAPFFERSGRAASLKRSESFRVLVRDRDQKITDSFDEVCRSAGIEIIRTPFRAPWTNGVAERFVPTG